MIARLLLEAIGDPKLETLPGVVTRHDAGPSPTSWRSAARCARPGRPAGPKPTKQEPSSV
jgi:hypothetical protein